MKGISTLFWTFVLTYGALGSIETKLSFRRLTPRLFLSPPLKSSSRLIGSYSLLPIKNLMDTVVLLYPLVIMIESPMASRKDAFFYLTKPRFPTAITRTPSSPFVVHKTTRTLGCALSRTMIIHGRSTMEEVYQATIAILS